MERKSKSLVCVCTTHKCWNQHNTTATHNRNHAKELAEPKTSSMFVVLSRLTLLHITSHNRVSCLRCVYILSIYIYICTVFYTIYAQISTYALSLVYRTYSYSLFYWIAAPNCIEMMACICPPSVAFTSFIFDKLCTCLRLSTHQIIHIFVYLSLFLSFTCIHKIEYISNGCERNYMYGEW